ncbi:MAG: uroporphyrinogen decarboxylase family protein [Dehalococcoidia bacterium]
MNSRQRFLETMRRGAPDRVPCFDEGLRDGVLARWHQQGLPRSADLSEMFRYDRRERVPADLQPRGTAGWRPTSRRALRELAKRLDPEDPQRLGPDWAQRVAAWRTREHVLGLPIHQGFFLSMGVGDWQTFLEAIYQLSDAPALVKDVMALQAEFAARLADRILADVEVDFVSFSEPIGGNDGPLLSPRMYEQIVLASYRPILEVVRARGVETIVLETYGNPRPLLPCVLEAGFNCLWAFETNPETMDYLELRREFGPDLRLIGGIDLDVLLLDKAAIRREIERKVPPLLAQGGYIPLADGRVRENVPFENYCCYRRLLEEVTATA